MSGESDDLGTSATVDPRAVALRFAILLVSGPFVGRMLGRAWAPGNFIFDVSFGSFGSVPGLTSVAVVELLATTVLGLYVAIVITLLYHPHHRLRAVFLSAGSAFAVGSMAAEGVFVPNLDPTLLNGFGLVVGFAVGLLIEAQGLLRAFQPGKRTEDSSKEGQRRAFRTTRTVLLGLMTAVVVVGLGQTIVAGRSRIGEVIAASAFLVTVYRLFGPGSKQSAVEANVTRKIGEFVRARPVVVAAVALTLLGLAARFVTLGVRPAHWDEARVAYWVDYTFETGRFAYNSHTHGPVVQHLSRYLFGILGPSDTTIRIPVAIIGGFLPLSALLYREHLRDVEVVVLSGLLTANAVLLYYSRFMRSDLLVATFMFSAFGFFVRFYDTRRVRYLYAAAAAIVLAVGSKENAPLYVLTWLGAGVILLDVALYRPRNYRGGLDLVATKFAQLRSRLGAVRQHPRYYIGHAVGIAVVAVALFTLLFAPRGGGVDGIYHPPEGLSLWAALGSPLQILRLVWDTLTYVVYPTGEYFAFGDIDAVLLDFPGPPVVEATASGTDPNAVPYLSRLFAMTGGLLAKAPAVVGFGLVGVLYERYLAERSRTLVLFMFFAALFSVIGYPLTLSIDAGWKWNMTHVVVPLSVPAAVGLGIVGRWAIAAYRRNDRTDLGVSSVVLVIVMLLVAWVAVPGAYSPADRSGDNTLVQYGQPADDLRPTLDQLQEVAATNAGADVVVYDGSTGDNAYLRSDPGSASKDFRPTCTQWTNLLPLNWYLAAYDADTECENSSDALVDRIESDDPPPVVMTRESDDTVPADVLETNYQPRTYQLRTYGSEATFYVHEDVLEE